MVLCRSPQHNRQVYVFVAGVFVIQVRQDYVVVHGGAAGHDGIGGGEGAALVVCAGTYCGRKLNGGVGGLQDGLAVGFEEFRKFVLGEAGLHIIVRVPARYKVNGLHALNQLFNVLALCGILQAVTESPVFQARFSGRILAYLVQAHKLPGRESGRHLHTLGRNYGLLLVKVDVEKIH